MMKLVKIFISHHQQGLLDNLLPRNRKGIGTKWVFKQKQNIVFREGLVFKVYGQITGMDFQDNFVADVQTAFLHHGDLEEEWFIKILIGYKEILAVTDEPINKKDLQLAWFKLQDHGGKRSSLVVS